MSKILSKARKFFLRNRILSALLSAAICISVAITISYGIDRAIDWADKTPGFVGLDYDTHEVVVFARHRYTGPEELARYSESNEQSTNPLLDPMYAGKASATTGYDPLAWYAEMIAKGRDFGIAEIDPSITRDGKVVVHYDRKADIMEIHFRDGRISWVDASGVIASAYLNDDNFAYVAFYQTT